MLPKRKTTLNIEREKKQNSKCDEQTEELQRALKVQVLPDSFGDKVAEEFEQELNSGELDWNIKFGMA